MRICSVLAGYEGPREICVLKCLGLFEAWVTLLVGIVRAPLLLVVGAGFCGLRGPRIFMNERPACLHLNSIIISQAPKLTQGDGITAHQSRAIIQCTNLLPPT